MALDNYLNKDNENKFKPTLLEYALPILGTIKYAIRTADIPRLNIQESFQRIAGATKVSLAHSIIYFDYVLIDHLIRR